MTIQVKANGQNFHVVLTVYHAVNGESVQSFGRSMDGTLLCSHSNESYWKLHMIPYRTICIMP